MAVLNMDNFGHLALQRQAETWSRAAGQSLETYYSERRASPRIRMFKKGKLIHPNNNSVFDCMIRDISDTGARLSCEHTGILPNELQLMFHALREVRYVRIVWRRPGEMGVQFLTPPKPAVHLHI
jgi:hypothetical protein